MIATLLSPGEIKASIESVTTVTNLAMKIRSGEWDADEMWKVADLLDRDISERKRSTTEQEPDQDYLGILAILTIMFYSKDKWGYSRDSEEYRSLQHLFGRLMAALDSWPADSAQATASA